MGVTVDHNLRTHKEVLLPFVGKKVMLGTTDFHYVVGRFVELLADEKLRLLVGAHDQEVLIPRLGVSNIQEVDKAVAEYVK